jgi:hypothetical protein
MGIGVVRSDEYMTRWYLTPLILVFLAVTVSASAAMRTTRDHT